jgi:ATP-dependent Clp endopeptidase proteolytic subunit ClpP
MSDRDEGEIIVNKFTEDSAKDFRKKVVRQAMRDPDMPIIIYIDSYGGYIDSLNSMLETIEQVPNPIVTVCKGKAMSCGAVLLAAGDHRFCGRRSRVMVHPGSSGTQGHIESLQNDVDESKRLSKELMTFIAERCGMSHTKFKQEMKKRLVKGDDEARDLYLPAEAAKEVGLVDQIGMPLIKPLIMYTIETSEPKQYSKETPEDLLESLGVIDKPKKKTKKKATKKKTKKKTTKKK